MSSLDNQWTWFKIHMKGMLSSACSPVKYQQYTIYAILLLMKCFKITDYNVSRYWYKLTQQFIFSKRSLKELHSAYLNTVKKLCTICCLHLIYLIQIFLILTIRETSKQFYKWKAIWNFYYISKKKLKLDRQNKNILFKAKTAWHSSIKTETANPNATEQFKIEIGWCISNITGELARTDPYCLFNGTF